MSYFKTRVRRVRFWWRLTIAYFSRYKYRILTAILAAFFVSFSAYKLVPRSVRANEVNIGYVGVYTLQTIPAEALRLATGSLITSDDQNKPVAELASHFEVLDDGKTYVVFLKDNLKWHDGTLVNAKDISIAISDVEINVLNNKTIQFKLPNPISSFPHALNKPVFKSESFYGTGDFRITNIDQVEGAVRKISLTPKDKNMPKVNIKFYPTELQAQEAVKIGEIKSANLSKAKEFENWPNLEVERTVGDDEIITIFFNNDDPLLSSKELRQALSHSINKNDFDGLVSTGPISHTSWAYNPGVKRYEYNTAKAKELLVKSQTQSFDITLSFSPSLKDVAESVKKDWEAIGIKVTLKEEKNIPQNFQALLTVNKLNPDPDQYGMWHSSQKGKTNITNYQNVKIDKLLEDARNAKEEDKRKELYFDFQRFLVEDAPVAFLYHPYKYRVVYKNAKPLLSKLPNYPNF